MALEVIVFDYRFKEMTSIVIPTRSDCQTRGKNVCIYFISDIVIALYYATILHYYTTSLLSILKLPNNNENILLMSKVYAF